MQLQLRPFAPETDLPFVRDSWLRSARQHHLSFSFPDITMLLERNRTDVLCEADSPVLIYAWICHSKDQLWFVYVKNTVRRQGLATQLLRQVMGQGDWWSVCTTPQYAGVEAKAKHQPEASALLVSTS